MCPFPFFLLWLFNFCYLLLPSYFLHVSIQWQKEGLYGKQNKLEITTVQEGGNN